MPVLRGGGVDRIDTMIVSHNDSDHSGGALSVLEGMPVGLVLSSLAATSPIHDRAAFHERCLGGQAWTWDGVEFSMLNPTAKDYVPGTKVNNLSCVLRVGTAHAVALFTGDIEKGAEHAMLLRDAPLRADLLIAPHHGSHTSSTSEFIAAVSPVTTVFTVGYLNRFGHPRPDVVARYLEAGSQIVRTDSAGAVTITLDDDGMRLDSYRSTHARYWQGR
jgi:competence protein ComEC